MNITLVGKKSSEPSEGMRKVLTELQTHLSASHNVALLDVDEIVTSIKPNHSIPRSVDIIHYVSGPSFMGLLAIKLLKIFTRSRSTVSDVIHPQWSNPYLLHIAKPDLFIIHSKKVLKRFVQLRLSSQFMPLGVDTTKFHPVNTRKREELREKFGLPQNHFIMLHVGHVKHKRNVELLCRLVKPGTSVVAISSINTSIEEDVYIKLRRRGVLIWRYYIPEISEIYQLADCYVFPVTDESQVIQIPLSVLEAMATNMPVITTKIGGLPDLFSPGDGLYFVDNPNEIPDLTKKLEDDPRTRDKVLPYDWKNVIWELERIYKSIVETKHSV